MSASKSNCTNAVHLERLKLFCTQCQSLICLECHELDMHQGHPMKQARQLGTELQKSLQVAVDSANSESQTLELKLKQDADDLHILEDNSTAAAELVKKHFERLHDLLQSRQKSLLLEIEKEKAARGANVEKRKESVAQVIAQIQTAISDAKTALQSDSVTTLLNMKKIVEEKLDAARTVGESCARSFEKIDSNIEVNLADSYNVESAVLALGSIVSGPVSVGSKPTTPAPDMNGHSRGTSNLVGINRVVAAIAGPTVSASSNAASPRDHLKKKEPRPSTRPDLLSAAASGDMKALEAAVVSQPVKSDDLYLSLQLAVENGHPEIVSYLLKGGGGANLADDGNTVSLRAAKNGHLDVLKWLVSENFSNLKETNKQGDTALLLAASNGHLKTVEWIVVQDKTHNGHSWGLGAVVSQHIPAVRESNKEGNTALILAARSGHLPVVQYLLQNGGASVKDLNKENHTALLAASAQGHLQVVQWLMLDGGASAKDYDKNWNTALLLASAAGHLDVVKWLIKKSFSTVKEANADGSTSLILAATGGHLPVVQFLLEEGGASIKEANKKGYSALLRAAEKGHLSTVQYLVKDGGASVKEAESNGNTPLLLAAHEGHVHIATWLLKESGSSIKEVNKNGRNALLRCAVNGHVSVARFLLKDGGASARDCDPDGDTILLLAAWHGHLPLVQYLLQEGGAKVQDTNKSGNTPLLLSAHGGHTSVVKWLLQEGGASIKDKDKQGRSVIDRAKLSGKEELVSYLTSGDSS